MAWTCYFSTHFAVEHEPSLLSVALILSVIHAECTPELLIPLFTIFDVKHLPGWYEYCMHSVLFAQRASQSAREMEGCSSPPSSEKLSQSSRGA